MNLYVNREVAKQFRDTAAKYDNRLGLCATAALLMFIEADPAVQGEHLRRLQDAELWDQVAEMLQSVREEQAKRVADRERSDKERKKK